jgi:hypothetical protein
MTGSASAMPAVGITPGAELVRYDTDTPGTILERHAITGLQSGETIKGLDVRPATGQLYALGIVSAANDSGRIYVIDPGTGAATQVGTTPFKTNLQSTEYGIDFNPAVDRIRVVNRGEDNVRVYPDTGELVTTDANLTPGDIDAIAYDQNNDGTPQTTLWGYDSGTDRVVRIGGVNGGPPEASPNSGMVATPFGAGSGISTTGRAEMDFAPGGNGFMTGQTAGSVYSLYTLNMSAGTVTLVGAFPEAVEDLALLKSSSFAIDDRSVTVTEDAGNATVTVDRTGNATGTQTIAYSTADGTATGADYTPTSGTLTFGPTETSKTFTIPVANDAADEPSENVALSLSAPTGGASLGAAGTGTLTIVDDDGAAAAGDKVKPQLLLAVPSVIKAGKLLRGLRGAFSCSEKCSASFTLKLGKATIGKSTKKLAGAGKGSFQIKLSKSGKKALRNRLAKHRTARVAVGVSGADDAGNRGTARASVSVSR